jgi:uncharacterized protein
MDRRWLLVAPSAALALLSVPAWLLWPPPPSEPRAPAPLLMLMGLAAAGLLLGLGWLLERTSPSFRHASRRLEHLVRALRLGPGAAGGVALVTGVAEEVFFRGWLLHVAGLWGQAALFMLLHPAGRRGWAYTAFTGFAGLVFGLLTLTTGSLLSALVAHVGVNLHGFLSAAPRRWLRRPPVRAPHPPRRSEGRDADGVDEGGGSSA